MMVPANDLPKRISLDAGHIKIGDIASLDNPRKDTDSEKSDVTGTSAKTL